MRRMFIYIIAGVVLSAIGLGIYLAVTKKESFSDLHHKLVQGWVRLYNFNGRNVSETNWKRGGNTIAHRIAEDIDEKDIHEMINRHPFDEVMTRKVTKMHL